MSNGTNPVLSEEARAKTLMAVAKLLAQPNVEVSMTRTPVEDGASGATEIVPSVLSITVSEARTGICGEAYWPGGGLKCQRPAGHSPATNHFCRWMNETR